MKALVLAHTPAAWLDALPGATCTALLPMGGRPLLGHTLDDLSAAGIREVVIAVADGADAIELEIGDGVRFGLDVRYTFVRPVDSVEAVVARLNTFLGDEYLLVRAEVLRTPMAAALVAAAGSNNAAALRASVDGRDTGLAIVRCGHESRECSIDDVEMTGTAIEIDSARAFHSASLAIVEGRFEALVLPGRELAPGVRVGRNARLDSDDIEGAAWIGARSDIEPGVRLRGPVMIGEDSVIDRGAALERCVVLPGSYVGRMVTLSDTIVWGDFLLPVGGEDPVAVADGLLVAELDAGVVARRAGDLTHRAAGLALLIASAPLWLAALLVSTLASPAQPLRTMRLRGNVAGRPRGADRDFQTLEWATAVPVLRHLPRLLAVVSGRLRLVGVEPLAPAEIETLREPWQRRREDAPAGLVGPWLTDLANTANSDEKRVVEGGYAGLRSPTADAALLLRAAPLLLTRRAWVATGAKMGNPVTPALSATKASARQGI